MDAIAYNIYVDLKKQKEEITSQILICELNIRVKQKKLEEIQYLMKKLESDK